MERKREAQAYVPNSTKSPEPGQAKYKVPDSGAGRMSDPTGDQSKAPATKPGMQPSVPEAEWRLPESGAKAPNFGSQSLAPDHKKRALPMKNAPVGVKGVNEGADYPLPKSGGKGETEV